MEYICGVTFAPFACAGAFFKPGGKGEPCHDERENRRKFRDICAWRVTGDTAVGGDLLHIKGDDGR